MPRAAQYEDSGRQLIRPVPGTVLEGEIQVVAGWGNPAPGHNKKVYLPIGREGEDVGRQDIEIPSK